jgi:hypothetical protein
MVAGIGRQYDEYDACQPSPAGKLLTTNANFSSYKNLDHSCLHSKTHLTPERRFVVRHQPSPTAVVDDSSISSGSSAQQETRKQGIYVAGFLDRFTSLCLGTPPIDVSVPMREKRRTRAKSTTPTRRVVYPIASFPVHLNSETLVDQRRKSLHQHFFRPVSDDEICPPI